MVSADRLADRKTPMDHASPTERGVNTVGIFPTGEAVHLNETIHQPTRLRIMTLLVSLPQRDRAAYGFIQKTLGLTGGNLTIHLRKLQTAGYLDITKEFVGSKPRTSVQATPTGRRAFADYLSNLEKVLSLPRSTITLDRVNAATAEGT